MTKATALYDDIPAPPPLGVDDAVDEMLVGLDAPPRARRRVLAVLLGGIAVVSLALAAQFTDDAVYALRGGSARSLGDGRVVSSAELAAHGNGYVTLRATPSMAGAVTYSRWLFPGEHLVFPIAGREGEAVYVQVSQDGAAAMARGNSRVGSFPSTARGGGMRRSGATSTASSGRPCGATPGSSSTGRPRRPCAGRRWWPRCSSRSPCPTSPSSCGCCAHRGGDGPARRRLC